MATQYADLLKQLVGEVGDVPPPQVEIVFRRCLSRFMEKSQAWRTRADFSMASAAPDPGTRATLVTAWQAALALAQASPNDLALAQAAEDARVAAQTPPLWTLTRPVKTPAADPVPAVYYTAVAVGRHVEINRCDAAPYWRINSPAAAGGNQTLELLPPLSYNPSGAVLARLYWTPVFDADPALAVPDWVFERYGGVLADWTTGELWMRRRGRRADQLMGKKMSNDAEIDSLRILARVNAEDPLTMSI